MIDKICMTFFLLWNTKEGNLNNVDYFNVQCSNWCLLQTLQRFTDHTAWHVPIEL